MAAREIAWMAPAQCDEELVRKGYRMLYKSAPYSSNRQRPRGHGAQACNRAEAIVLLELQQSCCLQRILEDLADAEKLRGFWTCGQALEKVWVEDVVAQDVKERAYLLVHVTGDDVPLPFPALVDAHAEVEHDDNGGSCIASTKAILISISKHRERAPSAGGADFLPGAGQSVEPKDVAPVLRALQAAAGLDQGHAPVIAAAPLSLVSKSRCCQIAELAKDRCVDHERATIAHARVPL